LGLVIGEEMETGEQGGQVEGGGKGEFRHHNGSTVLKAVVLIKLFIGLVEFGRGQF
jgi:hypothetical protein